MVLLPDGGGLVPPGGARTMPSPPRLRIIRPRPVLLPPFRVSPAELPPALVPSRSIRGTPAKPCWVLPSMMIGPVLVGRAEARLIVCTPEPEMLKLTVSAPLWLLALVIACRSEPA